MRGRLFIVGVIVVLFFLRILWTASTGRLIWLIGMMAFGIGCIIFLRRHGYKIR
jgi:uncharacterized membrane protein